MRRRDPSQTHDGARPSWILACAECLEYDCLFASRFEPLGQKFFLPLIQNAFLNGILQ